MAHVRTAVDEAAVRVRDAHRPGKLVFVNRYFAPDQSATSQLLTDLTQGLASGGCAVHVVCSRQLYDDPSARLAGSEVLGQVTVHRARTTSFGRSQLLGRAIDYLSFYISAACILLRELRHDDVLIAKTDPPLLSLIAAPIARWKRSHLVNWQQDVFPEVASHLGSNPLPRRIDRLLRGLRNASLRGASMNVAISRRMAEYFESLGIPRAALCVIENWADEAGIVPKPAAWSLLRQQLALSASFVVCYSGNLGRAHEIQTLLGAAELLRADRSVQFLMIGGGVNMESLRSAVLDRRLDNLTFLPYQPRENLGDSLAAGDVHLISLLPELEGLIMPSKLYGILASGRPVIFIGDADGDVARVIRGAGCGESVPVGGAAQLVATIRTLQTNPQIREAMGRKARSLFEDNYTKDLAVDRWRAMLDLIPGRRVCAAQLPRPSDR